MSERLFDFGIPILFALIFIYFMWAWIIVTIKPPTGAEDKPGGAKLYPRWNHLETKSEGIQRRVAEEVEQKRKAA